MRKLVVIFLTLVFSGCGVDHSPDFTLIDHYLETWDRFAQGDNSLIPQLKQDRVIFERHLADALDKNDQRAVGRFVFYAVIQVGGFIPLNSPVGKAFQKRLGNAVPIFTNKKDGSQSYFAGDLYFWWEDHKSEFISYPLYEEWSRRDFAQNVSVQLYKNARKDHE